MTRKTGAPAAIVKLVRARDAHACAKCGFGGAGYPFPLTTQHRVARGMGGTTDPRVNLPSNLLTLCGSGTTGCHGWVEAHPTEAKAHGWSVAWWADPVDVPVWTWRGWVTLLEDGNLHRLDPAQHGLLGVDGCTCGCQQSEQADLFATT